MASNDLAKALSLFGQVDGGLNRKFGGMGAGLTLATLLVQLHGGDIHIDSAVGVGTSVTVQFPPGRCKDASVAHVDSASEHRSSA